MSKYEQLMQRRQKRMERAAESRAEMDPKRQRIIKEGSKGKGKGKGQGMPGLGKIGRPLT